MITNNNATASEGLIDSVIYGNKVLTAKPGTPLAAMINALRVGEEATVNDIVTNSHAITNVAGGVSGMMDDIVPKLTRIVGNILDTAKNDAVPVCRDILEEVNKRKAMITDSDISSLGNLVQVELNGLIVNPIFESLIAPYAGVRRLPVDGLNAVLSDLSKVLSNGALLDLVKTGSLGIDAKLTELLAKPSTAPLSDSLHFNGYDNRSFDLLLADFVLMTGILNNRIDEVGYINEDASLRSVLSAHMSNLGAIISREIKTLTTAVADNRLVYNGRIGKVESVYPTIYLVGTNYRKWVKDSGSPEAVIGFLIANGGQVRFSEIENLRMNPSQYVDNYQQAVKLRKSNLAIRSLGITRDAINFTVTEHIKLIDTDSDNKAQLHAKLAVAIKADLRGDTELVGYIRDVVCATLGFSDDVRFLLGSIDTELADDEDDTVDMDTVIYTSTASLIGRWLANQLVVSDITDGRR